MRRLYMPHGSTVNYDKGFLSMQAMQKELERHAGPLHVVTCKVLHDMRPLHVMMFDAASSTTVVNRLATTLYRASSQAERPERTIVGPVIVFPDTDLAHFARP